MCCGDSYDEVDDEPITPLGGVQGEGDKPMRHFRRGMAGEFIPQYFPVPYSSLPPVEPAMGGEFIPAPGVISSQDSQPPTMGGTVVSSDYATPPLLPGLQPSPLGSAVPGTRALAMRGLRGLGQEETPPPPTGNIVDDVTAWLKEESLITGVPNMYIAAAGLAAVLFFGMSGGRR